MGQEFVSEFDFQLAASFFVLGKIASADLPQVAINVLVKGEDTPSIRRLAGEKNPVMAEAGPLFQKCLEELKLALPSELEAVFRVAKFYATKIVRKELDPYWGARAISRKAAYSVSGENMLSTFVGYASEIDDIPQRSREDGINRDAYKNECEEGIVKAAKKLLQLERPEQMLIG